MWVWFVAALILTFILIVSNQESTEERVDELEIDDEDDLIEEFLIIDLLDEEEEESYQ